MTVKTQAELKAKFETRKVPVYQDFVDLIESILHAQLSNFPDPLPAVSGKNLKDIGDTLPDPLPARDGKNLYNINPQEYNIPSAVTPSYASANTFVVTGDYTSGAATVANRIFLVGRRLRLTIAGSYTYTEVLSASYNAGSGITTVTTADNMPGNQLTACAVGIITPNSAGGAVGTGTIFGTSNTINGAINYAAATEAVAGTDYTGTHSPALSAAALVAGLELRIKFPTANTSTAPRYNPNGSGYKKIFRVGGLPLMLGDIVAGGDHRLSLNPTLDGGAGGYVLLNPGAMASEAVHKVANYNLAQSDNGKTLCADSAIDFTLPAISGLILPFEVTVKLPAVTGTNMGVACSGTDKIVIGGAEIASTKCNVRGSYMQLVADPIGKWQVIAHKWSFESSEQTIVNSGIMSVAHNLNVRPNNKSVVVRCKTADVSWVSEDEIEYASDDYLTEGATQLWADATNISVVSASRFGVLINRSTFARSARVDASWRVVFRADL